MLTESFVAPTPQEAYKLAINKYGSIDNFKLVSARQYMNGDEFVSEITIEVTEEVFQNASGISEEEALVEEMTLLKEKMNAMKEALLKEQPSSIETVKDVLEKRGLNKEWIDTMLNPFIGTQVAEDKSLLLSFILEEIEETIAIAPLAIEGKYELFVGPTGVGKTTSIAKIAAWAIKKGLYPQDIAIINLDNFRVGAYEQLGFYAKSLDIDYFCPSSAKELEEIVPKLESKELILIDTAGSSAYDLEKLIKTVEYFKTISHPIKVNLVISATQKYTDLEDIYNHFSFLNINRVILTKIDETRSIGNLIAFLMDTKLKLSFFSNGQNVPDDLEVATKRKILDIFVGEVNEES
jgi:flagellar biosynthesis protein FlhF